MIRRQAGDSGPRSRSEPSDPSRATETGAGPQPTSERLQKVLARAGFGSRRSCEELIEAGRVKVNGRRATLGRSIDPTRDEVAVDGIRIPGLPGLVHYVLNKPKGVVTTARDPRGRRTVTSMVPSSPRVFPVGRLDTDTEGLLVMTNDGELAQLLTHPSHGIEKEYLAKVHGRPRPGVLQRLRKGVELSDGTTAPAKVGLIGDPADGLLRIVIHEGRNRQVRRMCEAVGHPVRRLVRVRIGPIRLRDLEPGKWRTLTAKEVHALGTAANAEHAPGAASKAVRAPGAASKTGPAARTGTRRIRPAR